MKHLFLLLLLLLLLLLAENNPFCSNSSLFPPQSFFQPGVHSIARAKKMHYIYQRGLCYKKVHQFNVAIVIKTILLCPQFYSNRKFVKLNLKGKTWHE
jgi:hypothetical protein